jgi:hypothetical protein
MAGKRTIDQALEPGFADDLGALDLDELRRRRTLADAEENRLSYERRLLQGRRDLLAFELERRAGREERSLIEALPEILGSERASGRPARLGVLSDPDLPDDRRRRLDLILANDIVDRLDQVDDAELQRIVATLEEEERVVSDQRRQLHGVIDALHQELGRRYQEGSVDPLTAG